MKKNIIYNILIFIVCLTIPLSVCLPAFYLNSYTNDLSDNEQILKPEYVDKKPPVIAEEPDPEIPGIDYMTPISEISELDTEEKNVVESISSSMNDFNSFISSDESFTAKLESSINDISVDIIIDNFKIEDNLTGLDGKIYTPDEVKDKINDFLIYYQQKFLNNEMTIVDLALLANENGYSLIEQNEILSEVSLILEDMQHYHVDNRSHSSSRGILACLNGCGSFCKCDGATKPPQPPPPFVPKTIFSAQELIDNIVESAKEQAIIGAASAVAAAVYWAGAWFFSVTAPAAKSATRMSINFFATSTAKSILSSTLYEITKHVFNSFPNVVELVQTGYRVYGWYGLANNSYQYAFKVMQEIKKLDRLIDVSKFTLYATSWAFLPALIIMIYFDSLDEDAGYVLSVKV